ncbi:CAP domain-containing protein [Catenuloplanes japonicus]|uniref:CAP domain-containing protein n=1 Tax=Catenuloplanes japonicus TaxID=33876 RepID=UPI0006915343|nr:CAP domain-containing protein [Catenuloplanes japonicus]
MALVAAVLAIFGVAAYVLPANLGGGGGNDSSYDTTASEADRNDLAADPAADRGARPEGSAPVSPDQVSGEAIMGDNPASPSPSPSATPSAPASTAPAAPKASPKQTGGTGSGNSSNSGAGSGSSDKITTMEDAVTALVNQRRADAGCSVKVTTNEKLRTATRGHSQDMANQDYFDHTSLDGRTPWDRAGAAGYQNAIGENIAKGQQTAESVMESWMNSDGHRANILNCNAKETGVGLAYDGNTPIWTQMFGSGS